MKKTDFSINKKIGISFTVKQIELIDNLVASGALGSNRSEVIKQIVMFYLKEKEKVTNL